MPSMVIEMRDSSRTGLSQVPLNNVGPAEEAKSMNGLDCLILDRQPLLSRAMTRPLRLTVEVVLQAVILAGETPKSAPPACAE